MPAYQPRPLYRPIQVGPSPPQLSSQSSDNTPSPTTTTPQLGSKRGRITAIACVPCKKRKSKCNGLQPVCNTCAMKGSRCSYDMRQEHRWQGTLRVNVKKLEQELEEVKSVLPLLATTTQREAATRLALEIQNNGFSEHSADEIKKILEGPRASRPRSSDSASAVESMGDRSGKGDVTAGASTPDSMPAYYTGFDQNVNPAFPHGLPTTSEAQWPTHPLLTTGDSGVWMPDGTFSPPHPHVSPYREDSAAPAALPQGSKQNSILGPNASDMSNPAHLLNHPTMSFGQNVSQGASVSPVTYVFATYREAKRQQRADGCSPQKVFGPPHNDINAILGGETNFDNDQPLSVWIPRIANVFFSGAALPEKIATAEVVKEVLAWQVCPSRQNFEKLWEWARPTQFQSVIPHDPTIDFLPWPSVRDFFLHNPEHHVAGVIVNSLSVNWTYEESRMFYCDSNSGSLLLSPAFREHISNINNWTLAPEMFEQMPFLMGKVRATGMH